MTLFWGDERVAILTRLHDEGRSASYIAAELGGVSRNAVIGKISRLGLTPHSRETISNNRSEATSNQHREHKLRDLTHVERKAARATGKGYNFGTPRPVLVHDDKPDKRDLVIPETQRRQLQELDALSPAVVYDLIRDAVMRLRDEKKWDEALAQEVEDKRVLDELTEGLDT